jgi:hypothetical protein
MARRAVGGANLKIYTKNQYCQNYKNSHHSECNGVEIATLYHQKVIISNSSTRIIHQHWKLSALKIHLRNFILKKNAFERASKEKSAGERDEGFKSSAGSDNTLHLSCVCVYCAHSYILILEYEFPSIPFQHFYEGNASSVGNSSEKET